MLPNLQPDQHLLIDKLTPRIDDYSRGDIVVFHPPDAASASDTPFIKRVIALPGEKLLIRDGFVYINGHKLDDSCYASLTNCDPLKITCTASANPGGGEEELVLAGADPEGTAGAARRKGGRQDLRGCARAGWRG